MFSIDRISFVSGGELPTPSRHNKNVNTESLFHSLGALESVGEM